MNLYHNSRSEACRNPQGAVKAGEKVTLRILGAKDAASIHLRLWDGAVRYIPMERVDENIFETVVETEKPGLIWYDFRASDKDGREHAYGNAPDSLGGEGKEQDCPPAFQITVYDPLWRTPRYMHHGVMYQIFPDRYHRSHIPEDPKDGKFIHQDWNERPILMPEGKYDNTARDFFGGDLRGIEEKLDELMELGVTVLYLNPIFQCRSNHRYDTGDYRKVDPMLGTQEDFDRLCEVARQKGIRVVLDGVFSHTGDDSIYFNKFGTYDTKGAYQGKESPYYNWFTFHEFPNKYNCWWGIDTLPTVIKGTPVYTKFICGEEGVARKWLKDGAAGWRLDVADELPMSFLRTLKKAVRDEKHDALLLGEVWEDASHKEAYNEVRCYCTGDTLDSVMNYPLREAIIRFFTGKGTAHDLARLILSQQENYPVPFHYALMNLLGSHDRPRIINVLVGKDFEDIPYKERHTGKLSPGEYVLGKERFLKALQIICALPGTPCIYYGDEAGLYGGSDPYCRGTYPWDHEDKELKEEVKKIIAQRHASPALRTGKLSVMVSDNDTIHIIRTIEGGKDVFGQSFPNETKVIKVSR